MSAVSLVLFMFRLHRLFMAEGDKRTQFKSELIRQQHHILFINTTSVPSRTAQACVSLTAESQQAGVGDGRLTQVQDLKAGQMLG